MVVSPGSTQDLVSALRRLAQDPELRQRLGSAARDKVQRELSPACERENWLSVYNQVVSSGAPCVVEAQSAG